jgi:hypothetical protein
MLPIKKNRAQRFFDEHGELPKYTSIGCYPLFWVTAKNDVLCSTCGTKAMKNEEEFDPPVDCDINWEDADFYCDDCSERIESAYADD